MENSSVIRVRVTTRAKQRMVKLCSDEDGSEFYRVYVTEVPEGGKANQAVLELLAKTLKISKSKLSILSGSTSRNKLIKVLG